MNKVKKKIGWCDWTINPVKGLCPVGCSYCYARKVYNRNCNATFKDKSIRYDSSVWDKARFKSGERIFVGSTIDLFHDETIGYLETILDEINLFPKTTFIFLTKCPANLPKEFPDNCWVGVSATNFSQAHAGCAWLSRINAKVKFLSMEPLLDGAGEGNSIKNGRLGWQHTDHDINWLIIGAQTPYSQKTAPKIEWIKEIVDAADKANIPVFLKDNLEPLIPHMTPNEYNVMCYGAKLRQEFPILSPGSDSR